ncbi:MAG: hypothetical protein K2X61_04745 [Caulobacteraceae bacterium]|nr:hypothetical protein [Caulobacteraceae bacterium]
MARVVSYVNAFTAGEVGPDAWERTDLQQHAKGCAEGLNLIGLVTGPQASRGGFWDRGAAMDNATASRVVGFTRSTGDALFLEFGNEAMRVWTVDGARVLDGSDPYELETPWTSAEVARLWFRQINDVIFVTSLDGTTLASLSYRAADDWTLTDLTLTDGPWLAENPSGPSLQFSGFTVTASSAVFTEADVGVRIRFREGDGAPGHNTWTSATDYAVGVLVQFDGRVYQRVTGGTGSKSGTTPPLHQSGTLSDGNLLWAFKHDGAGIIEITDVASATEATFTPVRAGPAVTGTTYWARQAYSATEGFPRALPAERDERLILAASTRRPGIVDMTRTAGFTPTTLDFKPGLGTGRVVDDDAIRLDVGGTERVVWVLSAGPLIAGCTDAEYVLSGGTLDDPITPLSRQARPISAYGNADVAPLRLQGPPVAVLHVLSSRTTIRDTRFSPDLSVQSFNRSILPHHVHGRGIAEMAWQQPENIVWLRLDDGGLAAMAYDMEQEVYATTQQPLPGFGAAGGWTVESIATARGAGGDRLMLSVVRTKGGSPQRRMWQLARRSEGMFLDGCLAYQGAPATVISGLGVYEGESVAIVADGARVVDQVVASGAVTLPFAASSVRIGQKMRRRHVSLPLDMEGVGSTNARVLTPTHATVILGCVDALVGTDAPDSAERVQTRDPDDTAAPVVRRVRRRVGLGGGSDRDRRIVIETDEPFDLVLYGYRLEAEATP